MNKEDVLFEVILNLENHCKLFQFLFIYTLSQKLGVPVKVIKRKLSSDHAEYTELTFHGTRTIKSNGHVKNNVLITIRKHTTDTWATSLRSCKNTYYQIIYLGKHMTI